MQLFITDDFKISKEKIVITENRIVNQLRKVFRAKPWYRFFLQPKTFSNPQKRYLCQLIQLKNFVECEILSIEEKQVNLPQKWVITWILNKFDKMELIVQKLTELAVPIIGFVPTERSQFKNIPEKKLQRFEKIQLEATEQSFGRFLPQIKIFNKIEDIPEAKAVLNFNWKPTTQTRWDFNFLLIWPEWGFTENDLKKISPIETIKIGETVLRAETASIIGGYELIKNL